MLRMVWHLLPLCICSLVYLLQLVHQILLATIIMLPVDICAASSLLFRSKTAATAVEAKVECVSGKAMVNATSGAGSVGEIHD